MKLTFVDAGVLIAAARGGNIQAARAMEIFDDPEREFAAVAEIAMREASTNGVEAMDALHVAAAASVGASELITTEKPSRSIHRARAVKVVTIYPEA